MSEQQAGFNKYLLDEMIHRVVSIDRVELDPSGEPIDRLNNQFITLRSDFIRGNAPEQDASSDIITAWDVLKEDWIEIPGSSILKCTSHEIPLDSDHEGDDTGHLEYINGMCARVQEVIDAHCDDPECDVDRSVLCDKLYKYGIHMLEAQRVFKFKISEDRLIQDDVPTQPDLTEEELDTCRECWMDHIRLHRKSAFEELDQLEEEAKKEGSSEEDLADIDTIKQMFRDIPQDTDLGQYKSLSELADFWPSLLQPSPYPLKIGPTGKFMHTPVAVPDDDEVLKEAPPTLDQAYELTSAQIAEEQERDLKELLVSIEDLNGLKELLVEAKEDESLAKYVVTAIESRVKELEK